MGLFYSLTIMNPGNKMYCDARNMVAMVTAPPSEHRKYKEIHNILQMKCLKMVKLMQNVVGFILTDVLDSKLILTITISLMVALYQNFNKFSKCVLSRSSEGHSVLYLATLSLTTSFGAIFNIYFLRCGSRPRMLSYIVVIY